MSGCHTWIRAPRPLCAVSGGHTATHFPPAQCGVGCHSDRCFPARSAQGRDVTQIDASCPLCAVQGCNSDSTQTGASLPAVCGAGMSFGCVLPCPLCSVQGCHSDRCFPARSVWCKGRHAESASPPVRCRPVMSFGAVSLAQAWWAVSTVCRAAWPRLAQIVCAVALAHACGGGLSRLLTGRLGRASPRFCESSPSLTRVAAVSLVCWQGGFAAPRPGSVSRRPRSRVWRQSLSFAGRAALPHLAQVP